MNLQARPQHLRPFKLTVVVYDAGLIPRDRRRRLSGAEVGGPVHRAVSPRSRRHTTRQSLGGTHIIGDVAATVEVERTEARAERMRGNLSECIVPLAGVTVERRKEATANFTRQSSVLVGGKDDCSSLGAESPRKSVVCQLSRTPAIRPAGGPVPELSWSHACNEERRPGLHFKVQIARCFFSSSFKDPSYRLLPSVESLSRCRSSRPRTVREERRGRTREDRG